MYENKVELVGFYGSDETHALSAWTSTSRDLNDEKRNRIGKLLTMLATNNHHTPFEKSSIHLLVTTEIASHIQMLKHRIGVSFNGESARYKKLVGESKVYVPIDWEQDEQAKLVAHYEDCFKKYTETYEKLLARGVPKKRAKESARFYLPYCHQLTADVMFNFRSFMHFVGLRYADDAQLEIKNIAQEMLLSVEKTGVFTESLNAFGWTKEKIHQGL